MLICHVLVRAITFCFIALATLSIPIVEAKSGQLESAHIVYAEKLSTAAEGVHVTDGLVFVVVEIAQLGKSGDEVLGPLCLLRTLELLRHYASDRNGFVVGKDSNASDNIILREFPFLVAECRMVNTRFATSNFELKDIASRVLENRSIDKVHRYVTAFSTEDIERQISSGSTIAPTIDETLSCLRKRLDAVIEDDQNIAIELMLRCGAIEDTLNVANDQSSLEFTLSSFARPKIDSLDLYERWPLAQQMLSSSEVSVGDVRRLLKDWPGFPPAIRWLSESCARERQYASALNLRMLALVESTKAEADVQELSALVNRWLQTTEYAQGLAEYAKLLTDLHNAEIPKQMLKTELPTSGIVSRVWRTYGHVNFPDIGPQAPLDTPFTISDPSKGKQDVTGSANQFHEALKNRAGDSEVWSSMGAILLENGEPLAAIPLLTQSLRIKSDSVITRLRLSRCYEQLGYEHLQRGMALLALCQPSVTKPQREQALKQLQSQKKERATKPAVPDMRTETP